MLTRVRYAFWAVFLNIGVVAADAPKAPAGGMQFVLHCVGQCAALLPKTPHEPVFSGDLAAQKAWVYVRYKPLRRLLKQIAPVKKGEPANKDLFIVYASREDFDLDTHQFSNSQRLAHLRKRLDFAHFHKFSSDIWSWMRRHNRQNEEHAISVFSNSAKPLAQRQRARRIYAAIQHDETLRAVHSQNLSHPQYAYGRVTYLRNVAGSLSMLHSDLQHEPTLTKAQIEPILNEAIAIDERYEALRDAYSAWSSGEYHGHLPAPSRVGYGRVYWLHPRPEKDARLPFRGMEHIKLKGQNYRGGAVVRLKPGLRYYLIQAGYTVKLVHFGRNASRPYERHFPGDWDERTAAAMQQLEGKWLAFAQANANEHRRTALAGLLEMQEFVRLHKSKQLQWGLLGWQEKWQWQDKHLPAFEAALQEHSQAIQRLYIKHVRKYKTYLPDALEPSYKALLRNERHWQRVAKIDILLKSLSGDDTAFERQRLNARQQAFRQPKVHKKPSK